MTTEKTKHTPSQWYSDEKDEQFVIVRTDNKIIYCIEDYEVNEEDRANARLIAAAPELLEACKSLLHDLKSDPYVLTPKTINKARSAINKAEGAL